MMKQQQQQQQHQVTNRTKTTTTTPAFWASHITTTFWARHYTTAMTTNTTADTADNQNNNSNDNDNDAAAEIIVHRVMELLQDKSMKHKYNNLNNMSNETLWFMLRSLLEQQQPSTTTLPSCSSPATTRANPILRDIHLVMIGDSIMRYQYLSLAYRLKYGVWFDTSQWYYNLVNEKAYYDPLHYGIGSWGWFLFHTNQLLKPYEVCDCYRGETKSERGVENRYYYDPLLNNSIVFISASGHWAPIMGRLVPHQVQTLPSRNWQLEAFFSHPPANSSVWNYTDWADVVRYHIRYLDPQPQHIVMNAGAWDHDFGWSKTTTTSTTLRKRKRRQQTAAAATTTMTLSQATQNLLYVMYNDTSTTFAKRGIQNNGPQDSLLCNVIFPQCVDVSFTKLVRSNLFCDAVHFEEPVYRVINEEMLDLLGYLPTTPYVKFNRSQLLKP